jgi:N-acetylmuramoyl-L-alanine amidase
MSANPTRVDWDATTRDAGSPLQEGNRVLESIARQEALRALLAFSDLHEQIRNRQVVTGCESDRDLFETERFILDEVLQLICDRAQAITHADCIVVALAEERSSTAQSATGQSATRRSALACRASAGPLAIERGVRLISESEFLQDCFDSGRILRCDDCEIDTRVELDFARQIGARSTVLVPLRGRREQLGVLQIFSQTPWAFSDHDIRCFDLFAELVLSALKPEDQDRRINWLACVADEILGTKSANDATVGSEAVILEAVATEPVAIEPTLPEVAAIEAVRIETTVVRVEPEIAAPLLEPDPAVSFPAPTTSAPATSTPATPELVPALTPIPQEVVASAPFAGLPESVVLESVTEDNFDGSDEFEIDETAATKQPRRLLHFPQQLSIPVSSRPGLSVVVGLLAVAALFSAGAWWGMQSHGKAVLSRLVGTRLDSSPQPMTSPSTPSTDALSSRVSGRSFGAGIDKATDNLMSAGSMGSDAAPLTAVSEDKLATLPRITGVRHWSSSMGSTVVIDMEDQVPYEVHRLMSPERIYFDLHDTVLSPDLDGKTMDVGDISLTRVRIAQPVAGVTRVVLDTKDGSNFSVSMESSPYRLVVELRGSEKTLAMNSAAPSPKDTNRTTSIHAAAALNAAPIPLKDSTVAALSVKAPEQALPARSGKFRIVLDAGHGGWDLGTVGRQGLLEKDLVLDVTQRLGKLLQTRLGSEVMFTRTSDNYLPLDQRADFANQTQADLFVSVHANYSSSAAARGVETYYTNVFSAPGAKEVEKHDDGTYAKLTPVSLSSGALHEKIQESQRLAASVQHFLYATLSASSPDIRNRGIKDSAFVVLTGTTMPAILTEISFVSSPADEHNLQSATYRQQIAEALYKGIARYQETAPRAKVAQLQTARR